MTVGVTPHETLGLSLGVVSLCVRVSLPVSVTTPSGVFV